MSITGNDIADELIEINNRLDSLVETVAVASVPGGGWRVQWEEGGVSSVVAWVTYANGTTDALVNNGKGQAVPLREEFGAGGYRLLDPAT